MKRIIVIGCPGSGKSTFSRELHRITGIPLYPLDLMYWNADRTTVEKSLFLERLAEAMTQEEWIIDHPDSVRLHEPILWIAPDGALWHFWAQSYNWWDGRAGVWAMRCENPEAATLTWMATSPLRTSWAL